MNATRKKLYDEWRECYANDPARAVGWRNQESLDARFRCTVNHISHKNLDGLRVLDYGCGTSLNLLRYLRGDYIYTGVDCNRESLERAAVEWRLPLNKTYKEIKGSQLIEDEFLEKVSGYKFDIIIVQGVYQEFDDIESVRANVNKLSTMLAPGGELLMMTPTNRVLDAEGKSVLRLSAYDAVSILESTGLPYEICLGELGEHLIMKVMAKKV